MRNRLRTPATVALREVRLHRRPVYPLAQKSQFVAHVYETSQCHFKNGHLVFRWFFACRFLDYLQVPDCKTSIFRKQIKYFLNLSY